MAGNTTVHVEVAYATPQRQTVISLELASGSTAKQAIHLSGLLQQHPEIDLSTQKIGIFGQSCGLDRVLNSGDRIEIYRPLLIDPMQARRLKASQSRQ